MSSSGLHTPADRIYNNERPVPVICRPATPADLSALVGLLEEIMTHHGVPLPPQEDLTRTLSHILALSEAPERAHHLFLVAETADRVVGACALVFSLSTWSTGEVCELQDVVVTADEHRWGIGRMLLEAASALARARGCRRLFLSAEPANLGAHAFYRSCGFAEKTALYFEHDLRTPSNLGDLRTPEALPTPRGGE